MSRRTINAVISFTDADAAPDPMSTVYNLSTHGYKSPDSPYLYAPPRLKGSITFEKSIGTLFWGNESNVSFGAIDIDVEDGGIDFIGDESVSWVLWAQETLNPQCIISIELADRTLLHLATADVVEIAFPQDGTIRCRLSSKFERRLEQFVNDYVPEESTYDEEIQGQPVPTNLGAGAPLPPGESAETFEPRNHVKTILVDESSLRYMVAPLDGDWVDTSPTAYYVMDRGVTLYEGASPGFNLWENGFELTANPDGEITFIWRADDGAGWPDPFDSGATVKGVYRICRWAVDRAGIDIAEHFPAESDFPDLYPTGLDEDALPFLSYSSEVSAKDILNDAVLNLCGFWYVDEFGDFQFGKLEGPETVSSFDFQYSDREMIGFISARVDTAPGLSNSMLYSYSPGAININNLAGSITGQARRQRLSREWLQLTTTATIPAAYETARGNDPMKMYNGGLFNVRIRNELDRRWQEYYSGIRRFYTWTVPLRGDEILPDLGSIGTIQSDKAELLAYGDLPLVLTRIKYDLGKGLIQMEGWGGETEAPQIPCTPLDLGATADGESEIDLTWDEGDCGLSCELLEDGSINAPVSMPAVPSDPDYRRITMTVEQPQVTGDSEIIFSYLDEGGSPVPSTGVAWTSTEGLDGADFEVRIMPDGGSLPTTFSGDSVETWLPLTSDRSWTWEGFWASSSWNAVSVSLLIEFRKVGQTETCTSAFSGFIETGDIF